MAADADVPRPVALISGHTDLSTADFQAHYIPQLEAALAAGHRFILGDAAGVDTLALAHLLSADVQARHGGGGGGDVVSRITVYPSRQGPNIAKLRGLGLGGVVPPDDPSLQVERTVGVVPRAGRDARRWQHVQRDANMTAASDYDILYVRTDDESRALYGDKWRPRVSATEMNRLRRAELARVRAAAGVAALDSSKPTSLCTVRGLGV
ncbi:unnamed protein product [Discula destructiva]